MRNRLCSSLFGLTSFDSTAPAGHWARVLALFTVLCVSVTTTMTAQVAPGAGATSAPGHGFSPKPQSGEDLPVPGRPVPADRGNLSEHNIEWVATQPPQVQMEFLLGSAVNHDIGATNLIAGMVDGWRGKLKPTDRWETLQDTALYSNDLRVRAAAIEINLAVRSIAKTDADADQLMDTAHRLTGSRAYFAWELGMLANRGIRTERIHELLAEWIHDSNQQVRFWSVEGLAHLGTDETIKNFLDVFRNDPSLEVRERAGCSLAKSGMLTREQRMKAVPGLIELADDPSLDATTRNWVYQALREITGMNIGNDPAAWRNWYAAHGAEKVREIQKGDVWSVLGNS
ncbi:MAG: HEAT repeat domain-containing protein [Terriglobales bacterium]